MLSLPSLSLRFLQHSSLKQNWARLADNFDIIFTTEQSIEALKQTILQLAVMGKLVPQNPDDEPASVLLKQVETEKNRLIKEESLRTKAKIDIEEDEKYITQPLGWAWIRLGNLAKFIDYRGKTPQKIDQGIRLITAKNIRYGYIDLNPEEFVSEQEYINWMTRGFPRKGDTLFTPEAPLGNAANIDLDEKFALAQRAICFQWHEIQINDFMLIQLLATPFQSQLKENATGMTATGIKASKLKEIPIIIPH
nr:restriction endonuclease subunit S [Psychrobacter sp. PraFG1]UNK04452.1 restriction endonuclease subunit S [Psychrobacter sp. PraFG1]